MIQEIKVNLAESYSIYLGAGILKEALFLQTCRAYAGKIVILSDSNVSTLYETLLETLLAEFKPLCLSFPAGEAFKTRETKAMLEDKMQAAGCNRDTCLIALGGGVVSDLAGFIAATYCRGIPVIYLPTTLLAMVDASVGGKTAVNTARSKNSIGVFYQPKAVFMDIDFLQTLSYGEIKNGLSEILKHALIQDKVQFQRLIEFRKKHPEKNWLLSDSTWLLETIAASVQIKKNIVEQDEKELGLRKILNFGHTIAHVIELLSDYQIPHGQAVAVGLYLESELSQHYGHLSEIEFKTIEASLQLLDLNIQTAYLSDLEPVTRALSVDKKTRDRQWRFVLLDRIGATCKEYVRVIDLPQLKESLQAYQEKFE